MIETHRVWGSDIQAILHLHHEGWTFRCNEPIEGGTRVVYQREAKAETPAPLYAFWNHDQFPFFLGGEVAGFLPDGSVKIVGYGGHSFHPVKILPMEEGLELHQKLIDLKQEMRIAENRIRNEFMWKRSEVIEGILE